MSHIACCSPCTPFSVPYSAPIGCALLKGRSIVICGIPRCGASRFSINLMCGSNFSTDNIAFHFDVRFNYGSSHCEVVRNSRTCGQWGSEEVCAPSFPFTQNVPFEIIIRTKSHKFKVYVNNQHFIDFKYRIPVEGVNRLYIEGDVTLNKVII